MIATSDHANRDRWTNSENAQDCVRSVVAHSVSQKLIGSLARPIKIELALRPVSSGLEKGAELFGEAPFGAPRMFGGEVGFQSRLADAGRVP